MGIEVDGESLALGRNCISEALILLAVKVSTYLDASMCDSTSDLETLTRLYLSAVPLVHV
jgi:hypothetical protein